MDARNQVQAITASSGNVAAATATATLPAVAGKTTYLSGLCITGGGATSASIVSPTITGLAGGTMTLSLPVVAGVTLGNAPIFIDFDPDMPSSAVNTAIVATVPSLGTGNTNSTVTIWGYQL